MTNTVALASRLRAADDEALEALIARRAFGARGVHDFFDLAEALLSRDSIQRALAPLERPTLAALAAIARAGALTPAEVADALAELGAPRPDPAGLDAVLKPAEDAALVLREGSRIACYDAVAELLSAWPAMGFPSAAELAALPAPGALSIVVDREAEDEDAAAAEHAFTGAASVAELLWSLAREPAGELQKGGLTLPAVRRLTFATAMEAESVRHVLHVAADAGLVAVRRRQWMITAAANDWLPLESRERWLRLAHAWLESLPREALTLLRRRARGDWGDGLARLAAWVYPAADERLGATLDAALARAEVLGIQRARRPYPIAAVLLERGAAAAADALAPLLPGEVDSVYVQQDLSIIAPGPLRPAIDARLRRFADVEGRSLASSYRVSDASVARAVASGARAADLLGFLSEISRTGIPQPLEYLITETAERFGRVRVGALEGTDGMLRSYLRSDDATLMRTLEVDHSLAALGLRRDGDRLLSRFGRDEVFWLLVDQHYPVAAEDAHGHTIALQRSRVAEPAPASTGSDATALVRQLREARRAAGPDAEQAWLARQLEAAVRTKSRVRVEVRMPDGSLAEYTLEPTGVGGGRVRGRDHATDVERTLPLRSIHAVHTL